MVRWSLHDPARHDPTGMKRKYTNHNIVLSNQREVEHDIKQTEHVNVLPVSCQSSPAEILRPVSIHVWQLCLCSGNGCLWSAGGSGSPRTHWAAVKPWIQLSVTRKSGETQCNHLQLTSLSLALLVHCGYCSLGSWGKPAQRKLDIDDTK